MTIIKRADLGRPLTWDELDNNFQQVDDLTAAASAAVSSAAASAAAAASSATASANSALDAANSASNAATAIVSAVKSTVTFTTGGTLNSNLDRISDGTYLYYWTGTYPVTVPAGSTVAGTGGIAVGFWAVDSDQILRDNLSATEGFGLIGACPDIATLRTVEPVTDGQRITMSWGSVYYHDASDTTSEDLSGGVVVTTGGKRWKLKNNGNISFIEWEPVADGTTDNAWKLQQACLFAQSLGGASIYIPPTTSGYLMTYPVHLFDNVEVYGAGRGSRIIFQDPIFNKGRGGFVMGSSVEANRDTTLANYRAGTYPAASTENTSFVNPTLGAFLRDNQSFVQITGAKIHDLYLVATYTGANTNGGYGINFVNAQNCVAYNIWGGGDGWTQLIGMGSDTSPETPSCYNCHAWNLHVDKPNQARTFYSVGFISNSTDCSIDKMWQHSSYPADIDHGSCVATNVVENCSITNMNVPNLGLSNTAEGVLLNNSKGCTVSNINVRNCKRTVATFYTNVSYLDSTKPNYISNVSGQATVALISVASKYDIFSDFNADSTTPYDILFANVNASGNIVRNEPASFGVIESATVFFRQYLQNNTVKGYLRRYKYLRPADILTNSKSDTTAWTYNKIVRTKASTDLHFLWEVPASFKAVDTISLFCSFNASSDAAFTAGSTIQAELIQMVAFDGNISTAPYSAFSNTRVAATGQTDTTLTAQYSTSVSPGLVRMTDTTNGLDGSWYVHLYMYNNVIDNYMKEIRISYWG